MRRVLPLVLTLAIAAAAALWIAKSPQAAPPTATPATATLPELAPIETEEPPAEAPQAAPTPKKARSAKPWQKIESCTWKADRWNDGDSFHVLTGIEPPEIVARVYFVDTPEDGTGYRDRIAEQSAYFGITPEQAREIAREAAAFTAKQLAAPFTVWTRWRSALGRSALGRNYCIIITADGRDLNELLVENGLARIHGTRTALFDGRDSRQYLARLAELEAQAKAAKRGAWGKVDAGK
jgi:endonuclease YncB( thermonuclease family)